MTLAVIHGVSHYVVHLNLGEGPDSSENSSNSSSTSAISFLRKMLLCEKVMWHGGQSLKGITPSARECVSARPSQSTRNPSIIMLMLTTLVYCTKGLHFSVFIAYSENTRSRDSGPFVRGGCIPCKTVFC